MAENKYNDMIYKTKMKIIQIKKLRVRLDEIGIHLLTLWALNIFSNLLNHVSPMKPGINLVQGFIPSKVTPSCSPMA